LRAAQEYGRLAQFGEGWHTTAYPNRLGALFDAGQIEAALVEAEEHWAGGGRIGAAVTERVAHLAERFNVTDAVEVWTGRLQALRDQHPPDDEG